MSALVRFLSRSGTLWTLFLATVLITPLFPLAAAHWGLELLDSIADPARARALVDGMSLEQRAAHAWITGTIDVAYPFAYGGLLAGTAARCFPARAGLLALPALLAIPVDLLEGAVQVLALTGTADLLALKAVVTPVKFTLLGAALLIAAAGGLAAMRRRER